MPRVAQRPAACLEVLRATPCVGAPVCVVEGIARQAFEERNCLYSDQSWSAHHTASCSPAQSFIGLSTTVPKLHTEHQRNCLYAAKTSPAN